VSFDAPPGKIQLRVSVEGAGSQVLDTEVREITVPDLTGTGTLFGTPEIFRARTVREFQQLKADTSPVPLATREFSRTDRLVIRVPAYGAEAKLNVALLNRAGAKLSDLAAAAAPLPDVQQIDLPLASLSPGEYVIEIKAADGGASELVAFRIVG
jgi:hypothetical protein